MEPVSGGLSKAHMLGLPPRRIDRFWVYGSHVTQARPAACWPLLVEAAQAFGSGTHPTTEGCLRAAGLIFRASRRRRWHVQLG